MQREKDEKKERVTYRSNSVAYLSLHFKDGQKDTVINFFSSVLSAAEQETNKIPIASKKKCHIYP